MRAGLLASLLALRSTLLVNSTIPLETRFSAASTISRLLPVRLVQMLRFTAVMPLPLAAVFASADAARSAQVLWPLAMVLRMLLSFSQIALPAIITARLYRPVLPPIPPVTPLVAVITMLALLHRMLLLVLRSRTVRMLVSLVATSAVTGALISARRTCSFATARMHSSRASICACRLADRGTRLRLLVSQVALRFSAVRTISPSRSPLQAARPLIALTLVLFQVACAVATANRTATSISMLALLKRTSPATLTV